MRKEIATVTGWWYVPPSGYANPHRDMHTHTEESSTTACKHALLHRYGTHTHPLALHTAVEPVRTHSPAKGKHNNNRARAAL